MANGSGMSPPVYYSATIQIAGSRYRSRWQLHRGVFKCVEADKDIAWMIDKNLFSLLPKLVHERVYLRFEQ